ncbi:MAG: DNA helicase RecG [Firmicutes bacterium HGW-Firmicutes-11]|nr:MAG: DNA helicase RecG [Firmicutes bacterium HGW-Firmicutes-11]
MRSKDPVESLPGIGPKKASYLHHLKIRHVEDFLSYYPRDYEDRRTVKSIASLVEDETAVVTAMIQKAETGGYRTGKKRTLRLLVEDESGTLEILFFRSAYLEHTLKKGQAYVFFGKVSRHAGRLQMIHPEVERLESDPVLGLLPVYPLTSGLTQREMRKWVGMALNYKNELPDPLPPDLKERNRLCDLAYALENIHFPENHQKRKEAKFRLVFDELLILQLGLFSLRKKISSAKGGIVFDSNIEFEPFLVSLPFRLTNAQRRVLTEIRRDMEAEKVMSRLIQGDVGSGKTILAAAAAYKAVKCGYQAALMAPTEILANQHYEGLRAIFEPFGIRVATLTGSMKKGQKEEVLSQLASGVIDFVIGTHAMIQPNVVFSNLGLVITDEQHRFGVEQRTILSAKGNQPDILVMTATPIPRTLAVILYGDLDISVIDELPPGRLPVHTTTASTRKRERVYEFVAEELTKGRQAYVVAPLIDESDFLDVRSANELYEEICHRLPKFRIGLLHGAMRPAEKDQTMKAFLDGTLDVLVSTVVIEVGIHVPNATVMVIENAERFGLATLHQLRGRVGRGKDLSHCILVTDGVTELSRKRMETMTQTNDGFLIAEKDLELRGPGEFFGVRQHGLPEFRIADLVKHVRILETVRQEAESLLREDPEFRSPDHKTLGKLVGGLFSQEGQIPL